MPAPVSATILDAPARSDLARVTPSFMHAFYRASGASAISSITRRFIHALGSNIGPSHDIPAPDVGTNAQTMAWAMDTYMNTVGYLSHTSVKGVVTGKPLASGGTLAIQMPDNLGEPSHLLMEETARSPAFTDAFAGKTTRRNPMPSPGTYVECLAPQAASIEVWHTIYYHRLANAEAIVEWVKGTGLRPYLDAVPEAERDAFVAAYTDRIRAAYPAMSDGKVLLRFPRLFIVAVKA